MNPEQSQIYETVRALMDKKLRQSLSEVGFAKSQILFLEALLRLRQVCCDPRLAGHTKAPSAKLEVLIEMLQTLIDEGRRVLVFFSIHRNAIADFSVARKLANPPSTFNWQN